MHFRPIFSLFCSVVITTGAPNYLIAETGEEGTTKVAKEEGSPGRATLLKDLAAQGGWHKVYAAEGLLEIGVPEDRDAVRREFLALDAVGPQAGTVQVGIWRVLARAADDQEELEKWTKKIEALFLDPEEPRRLHALETLCKLRVVSQAVAKSARDWADVGPEANVPFCWWAIALDGQDSRAEGVLALGKLLREENEVVRLRTAFALGQLVADGQSNDSVTADIAQLLRAALADPEVKPEGTVKHQLQCALYLASHDAGERAALREALLTDLFTSPDSARLIATTLAGSLPEETLAALKPRLTPLLTGENFHLRWAAARLIGSAE